jgi:Na+/H+-dicarboxylate symporter
VNDASAGRRSPAVAGLVALVAGLGAGIAVASAGWPALSRLAALVEPLGTLWVNAIRMVLVPLVVSLLVVSVTSFADVRSLGRVGARTITWFLVLLAGAAVFAALAGPPLFSRLDIPPEASAALRAQGEAGDPQHPAELPSLRGFLVGLVPVNPIRAAADGAMLPLIVFTLLFALATTRLAPGDRERIASLFRAISQAMLVLVHGILRFTPVGVFALALGMARELGAAAAGAVGYYVLVLSGMLLALTLMVYPVVALVTRRSPLVFAQAVAPAQAVAAGTRSSLASLPVMIEAARARFGGWRLRAAAGGVHLQAEHAGVGPGRAALPRTTLRDPPRADADRRDDARHDRDELQQPRHPERGIVRGDRSRHDERRPAAGRHRPAHRRRRHPRRVRDRGQRHRRHGRRGHRRRRRS